MKINKIVRRIFNLYNLAIGVCIIVIVIATIIIIKSDSKVMTQDGVEIIQSNVEKDESITEQDAKKLASKQFKKLGEDNANDNEVKLTKIQRAGEEYYYVSSEKNTIEIKIKGGIITRINSVAIEKE